MFERTVPSTSDDPTNRYRALTGDVVAILDGEADWLAAMANVVALIHDALPAATWTGLYLRRGDHLTLGPFQGRPACTSIAIGRGVCGTAVAEERTQVVPDVHAFPGHIACDPRSQSEVVVPVRATPGGPIVAVLDVDADRLAAFSEEDARGLEEVVAAFAARIDWSQATHVA